MEKLKNVHQRMLEVQKKVTSVVKTETVKMNDRDKGYKAVSHDEVAAALHMPLAEAGIVVVPSVISHVFSEFTKTKDYNGVKTETQWYKTELTLSVKWINADNPSDFIESISAAIALDSSDKAFTKAYSLALKAALLKVHMLESRDDEEQRPLEKDNQQKPAYNTSNNYQQQAPRPQTPQSSPQAQRPQAQAPAKPQNFAPQTRAQAQAKGGFLDPETEARINKLQQG